MNHQNHELKAVIDNDLCIACGACIPACPRENLQPSFNVYRGSNEVEFRNNSDCSDCASPCVSVCPSIKIDFSAIMNKQDSPDRDGWIEDVLLGYSPLFQKDGKSSSGGVLRALTYFALKEKIPVLTLTKNEDTGVEYIPTVLREENDLSRMPGSIYHSSSFIGAIEHLRKLQEPCVIIAIPCQMAGILNYIKHVEPQLESKIKFTYGLVCGWMYSYHAHEAFKSYKKIESPITDLSYRGEDKVGLLKLKTKDTLHKFNRRVFPNLSSKIDYRSSYSIDLNRLRCRVCQDHTNLLADVIAGDAWLARKPEDKLSVIGVRSSRGAKLIATMIEREYLVAEKGTFADIIESQSNNLVYANSAQKLSKLLKIHGISTPEYVFKSIQDDISINLVDRFVFKLELFRRDVVRRGHYGIFWWLYLNKYFLSKIFKITKKVNRKLLKLIKK